jgi:hypothetical protein
MMTMADVQTAVCPFLSPGLAEGPYAVSAALYCRLPGGRVRVPTPDEIGRFCIPRDFDACPVYERHASH